MSAYHEGDEQAWTWLAQDRWEDSSGEKQPGGKLCSDIICRADQAIFSQSPAKKCHLTQRDGFGFFLNPSLCTELEWEESENWETAFTHPGQPPVAMEA